MRFITDAVEGRVPFDGFAEGRGSGDGLGDEGVDALADLRLPAGHCRDVGLDGGIAVAEWDLGVAAGEKAGRRRGCGGGS